MEQKKTVLLLGLSAEHCGSLAEQYQIIAHTDGQFTDAEAAQAAVIVVDSSLAKDGALTALCKERSMGRPVAVVAEGAEAAQYLSEGAAEVLSLSEDPALLRHRIAGIIREYETEALHRRVALDPLTGVYNRPFFMEMMRQRVQEEPGTYDLVCLELESYELLFGRYGKQVCDTFMSNMVTGLAGFLPASTIMGRIDGAHVVFLMPHVPFEMHVQMMQFCIMMGERTPLPFFVNNAGVYASVTPDVPPEEVYAGCLLAIEGIRYKHDTFIAEYDDAIRQRQQHLRVLEANMYPALQEKQFQVYYQPKYSTKGDRMNGAEALVRWIHPEMGFMNPGDFIPLFEQNGFIFELNKYILETVCADMRRWMDSGIEIVPVSVNISQTDFDQVKLAFIFEEIVDRYRIPHEYIHFEITETYDAPDALKKSIAVSGMRSRGFAVELDDFGTGYSTLSILKNMPVDVMKIDMSLVRSMFEPAGRAVLEGALFTAIRMNIAVVVEGVENDAQYEAIQEICDGRLEPDIQGFYFSKPLPSVVFEQRLAGK